MASISADSFTEPRLAEQQSTYTMIDMTDRSANAGGRVFILIAFHTQGGESIQVIGQKEAVITGETIIIPRKMTAALYHAAVRKGYLR